MAELALNTEGCTVTKTDELKALMRSYFCPPEWALFFEVYTSPGGAGTRTDAVAMNLYPSRGLLLHGFELKVSRSDWLRELKDAGKAEPMFAYCDHWWLVVGDRTIVKPGELPPTWGLIAPRSNGLLAITERAPKLAPRALDRGLFASLARRANEMVFDSIEDRVAAETKDLLQKLEDVRQERNQLRSVTNADLMAQVAAFEKASGINIRDPWRYGSKIGEIVKVVIQHGFVANERARAKYALNEIDRIRKDLSQLLDALPKESDG